VLLPPPFVFIDRGRNRFGAAAGERLTAAATEATAGTARTRSVDLNCTTSFGLVLFFMFFMFLSLFSLDLF
jgi:hypothetical protein